MNRFFIYEEYGAKYELMIKDVASAHRSMPKWQSYQKGLEVLAASLGPANNQDDDSKKRSLTIGDLLVKVSSPHEVRGYRANQEANPTSLQVPTALRRAVEAYTRDRLPILAHGDRKCSD